jgi:hypothetical protein
VVAGGYDTLVPLFAREGLGVTPVGWGRCSPLVSHSPGRDGPENGPGKLGFVGAQVIVRTLTRMRARG